MNSGSLVECVEGYPGLLEEGATYTVFNITSKGHILLYEVAPPFPYTCFNKRRFKEIQGPEEGISILSELEKIEQNETYEI